MTTTPHPTRPGYVLAPFNLDAAKAGVEACLDALTDFSRVTYLATDSAGKIVIEHTERNTGSISQLDPRSLRLVLPDPGEGYRPLEAGEKVVGPVKVNTGGEWLDLPFPEYAQFERGNIYAVRVKAVTEPPLNYCSVHQTYDPTCPLCNARPDIAETNKRLRATIAELEATIERRDKCIEKLETQLFARAFDAAKRAVMEAKL